MPPFVRTITAEWERLQITALASQIAFSAVFAIPPLLFFVMSIASVVNTYTGLPVADWLREQIEERAPEQVTTLLLFIVDEAISETSGGFASLGAIGAAIVAIYSASGVVNAIVNASVQSNQKDPKTGRFLFTVLIQVKPAEGPRGG